MTYLVDMAKVAENTLAGTKNKFGEWEEDTKRTVIDLHSRGVAIRDIEKTTGVPVRTLQQWQRQEWYSQYMEDINKERRLELNSRLSKIVDAALSKIEDRLENGDYVINQKTGEVVRKPVSIRDANSVAKDILGEQISLQKLDRGTTQIQTSSQELLKNLAKEFAKFNQKLKRDSAVDISYKEVNDTI